MFYSTAIKTGEDLDNILVKTGKESPWNVTACVPLSSHITGLKS